MEREFTIGIGGAAGDGLDKSGDTLAKGVSRMGLYVYAYNSYQSIIRGGHIWLRVRIGEKKVHSHGDHLNLARHDQYRVGGIPLAHAGVELRPGVVLRQPLVLRLEDHVGQGARAVDWWHV